MNLSRQPLSEEEIARALQELDGWDFEDDRLVKQVAFADFREAVGFIVRTAFEAESLDHHPEIRNTYNRVALALNTHDAGGKVTAFDVALAKRIDRL